METEPPTGLVRGYGETTSVVGRTPKTCGATGATTVKRATAPSMAKVTKLADLSLVDGNAAFGELCMVFIPCEAEHHGAELEIHIANSYSYCTLKSSLNIQSLPGRFCDSKGYPAQVQAD